MTGSGTPSAFSPAAVTATLSAAAGLPSAQGSAVVTRASSRRSHARPLCASSTRKKTYVVCA